MAEERKVQRREGEYLLSLLSSAVRESEPPAPPEGLDWGALYRIAVRQMVEATAFPAVKRGGACPEKLFERWQLAFYASLRKEMLFDEERKKIFAALDEEKIAYIPLKGIVLKDLYPRKGMRQFSDNDILYEEKKSKQVRKIMKALGYTARGFKVGHDMYEKEPVYNFEMHRTLFSERYDFYEWFLHVWDRAQRAEGYRFQMKKEDEYLYFLAHFKKHYEDSGAGLRSFLDLYLLEKEREKMDGAYLQKSMEETGTSAFFEKTSAIARAWFGNDTDKRADVSEEVFDYVLSGGAYGSAENAVANKQKEYGGVRAFLHIAFPPYREMTGLYPVLKKAPVLLPWFYLVRLFSAVFNKNKRKKAKEATKALFGGNKGNKKE